MKRIKSAVFFMLLSYSILLPYNAMATINWANNATSLVAGGGILSGDTSVTVTTGQGDRFPAVASPHYFMMTLIDVSGNREIVKVTARTAGSDTMTIVRAQEGTAAQAFAAGSYVDQRITKHSLDAFSEVAEQFVNYYVCDASAADQADTVNSNSLASLVATIGTSANATIVLPHTGTGNTTAYNVLQNLDLSTYGNINFVIQRGAVITHGTNTINMPAPQCGFYQITNQSPVFSGTGVVTLSALPDIASATALPVLYPGHADVTGTTAITSINSIGTGSVIKLHFDGALTLTHHATDLILPGGANITTAAGDEVEFTEYAPGDWRCTNYQRAAVTPPPTSWKWEFRGALVKMTVDQSIPNGVDTFINWTAETYDTDNIHSTSSNNTRLTVPSGITKVKISCRVRFAANAVGYRDAVLYKNNSFSFDGAMSSYPNASAGGAYTGWTDTSAVLEVTGGDYFELRVYQNSGGALNFQNVSWFAMEIIE